MPYLLSSLGIIPDHSTQAGLIPDYSKLFLCQIKDIYIYIIYMSQNWGCQQNPAIHQDNRENKMIALLPPPKKRGEKGNEIFLYIPFTIRLFPFKCTLSPNKMHQLRKGSLQNTAILAKKLDTRTWNLDSHQLCIMGT